MELSRNICGVVSQVGSRNKTAKILAGVAAVAIADAAHGSVMYVPVSEPVNATTTNAPIDFDQDGVQEFGAQYGTFGTTPYLKLQINESTTLTNEQFQGDANLNPLALTAGTSIGAATDYTTGSTFVYGVLNDPGTAPTGNFPTAAGEQYIGVEFTTPDMLEHYGYIAFESTSDDPASPAGEVLGYAYESTANTPILAGAVPEPSSLGLLALGAVGLTRYRSKRKA